MKFISKLPHLDFIRHRYIALAISAVLITAGITSLVVKGGPNYGIDFTGGTLVQLKFEKPVALKQMRQTLDGLQLGDYLIQELGEKGQGEVLIRVEKSSSSLKGLGEKIAETFRTGFKDNKLDVRRVEMVGPKVGKELRQKGLLAIAYAMLGMLIYVAWRFELKFAVAAVIAIMHDVIITVGIFSIADKEITLSVVAALLTIAGYSINDTIVVFDRFREDLRIMRKESYAQVLNTSINQTLSRTILTSLTTLMVTATLLILGGEVIHDFAFALTIGVVVGTYSSMFVASPIVFTWHNLLQKRGKTSLRASKKR